jgi:NTE family protein
MLTLIVITGCAGNYREPNTAITAVDTNSGYRHIPPSIEEQNDNQHRIFLALSGGGTRASALSYGVMQELRDTTLGQNSQRTILSEVDTISAVSGGSFTAAYYALYRENLFTDFEDDFLYQNIQSSLTRKLFNPTYWFKSLFTAFNRSEMAIDYYDLTIFKGATFGDIPIDRPYIRINATELATGTRFGFTQARFDLICSDLDSFSISRAVTASSAVPVAFPSIVLKNHVDKCDLSTLDKPQNLSQLGDKSEKTTHLTQLINSYKDTEERGYIHLVDGGIADNLGLRSLIELIDDFGDEVNDALISNPPQSILFVLVNAETRPDLLIERSAKQPSIGTTIGAFTNTQISRYNRETRTNLLHKLDDIRDVISEKGLPTKIFFSEVSFRSIEDNKTARFFNNLPTSLELKEEEVDSLIASGRLLLRTEPEYLKFVEYTDSQLKESTVSTDELCKHLTLPACIHY